jgi:hypothetical protein
MIIAGATGGSTVIRVRGVGGPGCVPGPIQVFDCGPDRLCHTADDIPLAVVSATLLPSGDFLVTLAQPLVPGQRIYATDGCTNPLLSLFTLVRLGPAPVPTLSGSLLVALGALLAFVGLLGLTRLRWRP